MQLHENVYRRDVYLQYVIDPGADHLFQHREFTYRVKPGLKLGQAGFRGSPLQSPGMRASALGDSFLHSAVGVEHDSTWVARIRKTDAEKMVNLGVPGVGSLNHIPRALEQYGAPLKPKVVWYALYRNDLQDVLLFSRAAHGGHGAVGWRRPDHVHGDVVLHHRARAHVGAGRDRMAGHGRRRQRRSRSSCRSRSSPSASGP